MIERATIRSYADALRFLMGRLDYERGPAIPYDEATLKLARMRELVRRIGDPHLQYPVIHIAGTKGKGSTATMLGAVLSAAGYRVGTYTSPHLNRLEERFAINGRPCSPETLVRLLNRLALVIAEMDRTNSDGGPTYFEITTALAFLLFQNNVDVAIVEVGLGGRLDSTNVCQPLVSVITSISLDHTRQLGSTLGAIAREKAGIIKPDVPVVSGVIQPEPAQVIQQVAREHSCRLIQLGRTFSFRHQFQQSDADCRSIVDVNVNGGAKPANYPRCSLGMIGAHQAANAAVAVATVELLNEQGWGVDESSIRAGLSRATCGGRVEFLSRQPLVIADGAHNVASTDALIEVVQQVSEAGGRQLIFASSRDKDAAGMLARLVPLFDRVILTRYLNNPRSIDPDFLAPISRSAAGPDHQPEILIAATPVEAWEAARNRRSDRQAVIITGSLFIAAELRELILG